MRRHSTKKSLIALGVLLPTLIVGISGEALSQQRPLSISDWLKAEQNNANMQRAVEEYERAQFNSVPQQQQRYQQPASPQRQQQAQTPSPQAPRQWTTPGNQQPQPDPLPGGELPQRGAEQNTYQVPDNALDTIDKQYSETNQQNSSASSGYYVSANIGWPIVPDQDVESGSTEGTADYSFLALHTSGAAGKKFRNGLNIEILGSFQIAQDDERVSDGYISVASLLANAKMEFPINQPFTPYASAGIGPALLALDLESSTSSSTVDDSAFVFAYQLGFGALYPLSDRTSMDFGYRYFGTTDADISSSGGTFSTTYSSHSLMVGIKHQL